MNLNLQDKSQFARSSSICRMNFNLPDRDGTKQLQIQIVIVFFYRMHTKYPRRYGLNQGLALSQNQQKHKSIDSGNYTYMSIHVAKIQNSPFTKYTSTHQSGGEIQTQVPSPHGQTYRLLESWYSFRPLTSGQVLRIEFFEIECFANLLYFALFFDIILFRF